MEKQPVPFGILFLVNVAACYAPALLWIPGLPGSSKVLAVLFSPVLLALVVGEISSLITASVLLASFLLAILLLSALFCRRRLVSLGLLLFLFTVSLLQGLIVYGCAAGLDAMGKS
jgi:hypothetical protein